MTSNDRAPGRHRGRRQDFYHELSKIISVGGEGSAQVGQLLAAEGADRLLDQVMEQLLDQRGVGLFAGGEQGGQVADAVELDPVAAAGLVGAGGVDRSTFFPISISADRVIMLQ